jgi:hypothetical protein
MADTIEISVKNEDATEVTWPPTKASFKDLNGENGEEKSQTNGQQASAQENGLSISSASNSAAASIKMVSGVNAITGLVTMPLLQQTGKVELFSSTFLDYVLNVSVFKVFVGPGAEKEAQVLCLGLAKLRSYQKDDLERAKRYAQDQSVKHVLTKQQIAHQQNVELFYYQKFTIFYCLILAAENIHVYTSPFTDGPCLHRLYKL